MATIARMKPLAPKVSDETRELAQNAKEKLGYTKLFNVINVEAQPLFKALDSIGITPFDTR